MERWIEKNKNESIKLSVNEFKGKELLDIRTYYFDEKNDSYMPTKKGISIPIENIDTLVEELNNIQLYKNSKNGNE